MKNCISTFFLAYITLAFPLNASELDVPSEDEVSVAKLIAVPTDYFTSLCIADASSGLIWEDSRWEETNYELRKYLASKVDTANTNSNSKCHGGVRSEYFDPLAVAFDVDVNMIACYNIRSFGDEKNWNDDQYCDEIWIRDGGEYKLKSVKCLTEYSWAIEAFTFIPDGHFNQSRINTVYPEGPEEGNTDSMKVSTGSCSKIQ